MRTKLKRKGDAESPVFEAARLDQTNAKEILSWTDDGAIAFVRGHEMTFVNLSGSATITPGDWILKGPGGKFYPTCRKSVLECFVKV